MNLEKCPFCGSTNLELEEDATVICNDTEVWVQCLGCGACGPRVHLGYRIEDENSSQIDLKAEATEAWRIRFATGSQFWSGDEGKPQDVIEHWVRRVIGDQALTNRYERGLRVAEEAIELAQAMEVTLTDMQHLAEYVFSRPVGDPAQEIAGTMVTLYAAAACIGTDAEKAFETECARIHTPEIEEKVRRRQTEKRERMLAAVGPMEVASSAPVVIQKGPVSALICSNCMGKADFSLCLSSSPTETTISTCEACSGVAEKRLRAIANG